MGATQELRRPAHQHTRWRGPRGAQHTEPKLVNSALQDMFATAASGRVEGPHCVLLYLATGGIVSCVVGAKFNCKNRSTVNQRGATQWESRVWATPFASVACVWRRK